MLDENVKNILSELEQGYDMIADKFSSTRAFMWRDLEFVKGFVKPGDRVLDFGCGSGRLAGFLLGKMEEKGEMGKRGEIEGKSEFRIEYVGVDISQKLIDIAKQKYNSEKTKFIKISANAKRSDRQPKKGSGRTSFALPFEDNYFDVVFAIAVFHHLPGTDYRLEAAKELNRVLKPGGKIIISVWNLGQRRFWKYHLRFGLEKIIRPNLGEKLDWGDLYIPFKTNEGEIFRRYHHAYTQKEIKIIMKKAGFNRIRCEKNINITCKASK